MANEGMQKAELFVELFYKHIRDGNIKYVTDMYEITFNKISEEYFKNEPWPHPSKLKHLVSDYLFWMLYNELYFRRMSSLGQRRPMGLELRKEMWDNYAALFSVLVTANAPLNLPNVWLWDMVDEFLYQFQFYRALAGQANTKPDIEFLRANPDVWSPEKVRETLEAFVAASGIRAELSADNGKRVFDTAGFEGPSNVRRMLGYFSLVGLCRFHEVTGDHEAALRSLSPLNPYNRQFLYTTCIPMANVNLYYYSGVAYLMMRRYMDAGRCFNTVLSFLLRVKGYLTKDHRYDLLLHKNEQLYKLLAITVALCPPVGRWCEEQVHEQLVHKCQDTMARMHSGQADAYQRLFLEACPRYASPQGPDLEGETDTSMLGIQQQTQAFLKEVEATHQLPDLKRLLRLYTSISTTKLAQLLNTEPERLVTVLNNIQARSMQKRWVAGEAISGEVVQTSDVHFNLEKDEKTGEAIVVVKERRAPANHLATLAKHIVRFEQITSDMEQHVKGAAAAPAAVAAR